MEKDLTIPATRLILIGGSAGSLEVILTMLPHIIISNTTAVIIILHRKHDDDSTVLIDLLQNKTNYPVKEAGEKEMLTGTYIYIVPGGYHLLVEINKSLSLDVSEKIHYSRPSIDITFQTAADAYGANVSAILLSGASNDGTEGLIAIKNAGGVTIVQEPATAAMSYMPEYAVRHAHPDKIFNSHEMINYINQV